MALKILKSGIADSVQDIGRFGFQHLGINPTGVSDIIAATMANALVGNDSNAAILELHFPASTIYFTENTCIALSGADFGASINGTAIPMNTPILVKKETILKFEKKSDWGCRCYLSVRGGFDVPMWLKSRSTNTNAKVGGYEGRNLKKEDELETAISHQQSAVSSYSSFKILPWHTATENFYRNGDVIRVVKGNEFERLKSKFQEIIDRMPFLIGIQSNRMGYRLHSEALKVNNTEQLLSTAVSCGTIQLLPNGQLIILMADHQTTGGYPRLAHVIAADIPTLAQKNVQDKILFRFISMDEAEEIYLKQQKYLEQMAIVCRAKWSIVNHQPF